jgi:GrpB-like predicted nucleotidyltransferase (UPF0157 family)
MIILHEYQPAWPDEFELIRSSLQEILGVLALRIDHIGSTSVPRMSAKDVIDIQVTVKSLTPQVKHRLIQAGYEYWETVTHDHVPLGEDANPR